MAKRTKAALKVDKLDVVADRGYFTGEETRRGPSFLSPNQPDQVCAKAYLASAGPDLSRKPNYVICTANGRSQLWNSGFSLLVV
jgi:hypothetical protein